MSKTRSTASIDRPALLRLAAAADADPRTVLRVLRGESVRGRAGERIALAIKASHISVSEPKNPGPGAA